MIQSVTRLICLWGGSFDWNQMNKRKKTKRRWKIFWIWSHLAVQSDSMAAVNFWNFKPGRLMSINLSIGANFCSKYIKILHFGLKILKLVQHDEFSWAWGLKSTKLSQILHLKTCIKLHFFISWGAQLHFAFFNVTSSDLHRHLKLAYCHHLLIYPSHSMMIYSMH